MSTQENVVLAGQYCAPNFEALKSALGRSWSCALWTPDEDEKKLHDLMANADAVVAGADALLSGKLTPAIGAARRLRLLQIPFSGHDWLDTNILPTGCVACNIYEHHTTIAEYVLSAMLEWEIGLRRIDPDFRTGSWAYGGSSVSGTKHGEIRGKTVGILGYGRIGQEVAKRASAFDMKVVAVGRSPRETPPPLAWHGTEENFADLVSKSDYLVLTCPLTDTTRGIINADVLGSMKPSAVLINVARGPVVVEEDLFAALKGGVIAGAVLDVWYAYPTPAQPDIEASKLPFHELQNTILTPHCAAWTDAQDERRWSTIAENLERLHSGRELLNTIIEA